MLRSGCIRCRSILPLKGIVPSTYQIRYLFSGEELGITNYELARKQVTNFVRDPLQFKQTFKEKFIDVEESNFTKYENGVKDLLHVINNNESDMDVMKIALDTLIQKQSEFKGNKYSFGTVIMRLFYFLDTPKRAIEFFDDKNIGQLFTQITGHQILLDLLYEHKMYSDLLRIYNSLNVKGQLNQSKQINVIVLATYYRINTLEALDQACFLWEHVNKIQNKRQFRKCRTFVAGLALNQSQPQLALDILEDSDTNFYKTLVHIRLLAWAQLNQFDKVLKTLRLILQRYHKENVKDQLTSIPVLDDVQKLLVKDGSKDNIEDFCSLCDEMKSYQLVTTNTLDDMICERFLIRPVANTFHLSKKL